MEIGPDEQGDGDADRHDEHVLPRGRRLQQLQKEREHQVELEEHDHDVQLVVAEPQIAPEIRSPVTPRTTRPQNGEQQVDARPREVRDAHLHVSPDPEPHDGTRAGYLGVTNDESGEEEEGVPGEVQERDARRSDDVVRHVGPQQGVLPQDARTGQDPEEVEHRQVAGLDRNRAVLGTKAVGTPVAGPRPGSRSGGGTVGASGGKSCDSVTCEAISHHPASRSCTADHKYLGNS